MPETTKTVSSPDKPDKMKVNDKLIRIIGVQFFGIVIPNATGLISNNDRSITYLLGTYGFFIAMTFLVWEGNRFFLFKLQKRFDWFIHPLQKTVVLLAMNVFYTAPVVIGMLLLWYYGTGNAADWQVIQTTVIVCVISVVFITHVYETVFLIKQRQDDLVRGEQLERAKAQAELEVLKNQIDPHFMFNSLNSLSYLIDENQSKAKQFTESLAEVYRYILSNKDQELVILEDELVFLQKYIDLLKLRFGEALKVMFEIKEDEKSQYLIPPISVFIALENVVKHNELSKSSPLTVTIGLEEDALSVQNRMVEKKSLYHSTKIGLNNLKERFRITVNREVIVKNDGVYFELMLPLLKLTN
ncbi:MAG: histidine kinase [Roseivirga sp.]|nr:histidine kinase [Roseivirga sp.]